jgi:hypothetical protein
MIAAPALALVVVWFVIPVTMLIFRGRAKQKLSETE